MSQQSTTAAMKANQILDCSHRGITSSGRGMIIPLSSELFRLHLEHCVLFWPLQFKTDTERIEKVYRRAMKITRSLENLPSEERLKELDLVFLEKRKLKEDLITTFQYLMVGSKKPHRATQRGQEAKGASCIRSRFILI